MLILRQKTLDTTFSVSYYSETKSKKAIPVARDRQINSTAIAVVHLDRDGFVNGLLAPF
jgi:hypothetical protein